MSQRVVVLAGKPVGYRVVAGLPACTTLSFMGAGQRARVVGGYGSAAAAVIACVGFSCRSAPPRGENWPRPDRPFARICEGTGERPARTVLLAEPGRVKNGETVAGLIRAWAPAPEGTACRDVNAGRIDPVEVLVGVRRQLGGFVNCVAKQRVKDPDISGRMVIGFLVGWEGDVRSVRIHSSDITSLELESCIVHEMRRWRFSPLQGGEFAVAFQRFQVFPGQPLTLMHGYPD